MRHLLEFRQQILQRPRTRRAEEKNLDQNAATQEELNARIQDFEVTFESTPKGTQLRKASDKVRMPQWVYGVEGDDED